MASASPSSFPQGRMPSRRETHASLAGTGCASSLLTNAARERVMERGMMKLYLNRKKGQAFFLYQQWDRITSEKTSEEK